MTPVYRLNNIESIVQSMINHMSQQVETQRSETASSFLMA